jgi:hypothetical protein
VYLLNRRRFLQASATSILAAPFVRLVNRPAYAAPGSGTAAPPRLVVFFTPNGTIHEHWRPSGGESDFSFSSGSILEALSPYRDQLLVLEGMDFCTGHNHAGGLAAMLTAGGTDSIDQVIADQIGGSSRFASMELGAQTSFWGGTENTRMSYRDGRFVTPNDSPLNVYDRMFADLGNAQLLSHRQRLLDIHRDEIGALRSLLGTEEQQRLDAHLESLDTMERAISGGASCASPAPLSYYGVNDNDSYPQVVQQQLDLAVQAMACDMTRVVSVQLSHTISQTVFTWLGHSEGHHNLSHAADADTSNVAKYVECERWYTDQFLYLLDQLSSQPDPATGAPLLDNTLVLWAQELGDGRLHTCVDVPWILAGNAAGFFRMGRKVDLTGETHDGVLTSIAQAFGVDLESFGAGTSGPIGVLS